jgi:hypothetical protein
MLNLERILESDRLMRAMTGLNRKAFEQLLPSFSEAYEHHRQQAKVERKRALGGGRKGREANPLGRLYEPVGRSYFIFWFIANAIRLST